MFTDEGAILIAAAILAVATPEAEPTKGLSAATAAMVPLNFKTTPRVSQLRQVLDAMVSQGIAADYLNPEGPGA